MKAKTDMNVVQSISDVKELLNEVTILDLIVCGAGLFVLVIWLARTSFATMALVNAPPRRNDMPIHLGLIPFLMWFATLLTLDFAKKKAFPGLPGWQDAFADNLIMCLGVAPAIAAIVVIAKMHFARGLKGLGLNSGTIGRDLRVAFLNLLAIMPVVVGMIILTMTAGKFFVGPEFEMPRHEELKEIMNYSQVSLRVLIVVTTILIVPVIEELVFRGMFQTLLRSYIERPWPAIIIASVIFVICHEDKLHWPTLFALSLCLGYAYEKSGSLFRSIFIHSMFNALSVFAALGQ